MGSFEEVCVWCSNQYTCTCTDTQTCDLLSPIALRAPPHGVHLCSLSCPIHPLHAAALYISIIPIWHSSWAYSSLDFTYADFEHFLTVDLEALIVRLSEGESGWFLAQHLSTEPVCAFRVNTSRSVYTEIFKWEQLTWFFCVLHPVFLATCPTYDQVILLACYYSFDCH